MKDRLKKAGGALLKGVLPDFDASTGSTGIVSHGLTALCLVLDQKGGAF